MHTTIRRISDGATSRKLGSFLDVHVNATSMHESFFRARVLTRANGVAARRQHTLIDIGRFLTRFPTIEEVVPDITITRYGTSLDVFTWIRGSDVPGLGAISSGIFVGPFIFTHYLISSVMFCLFLPSCMIMSHHINML